MKLPKFDYASPTTIGEAVAMLSRADGTARVISGGQSLMPMLAFRLAQPSLLVDLRRVPGLDKIAISAEGVQLGARVRWHDIETSADLAIAHPLLTAAVKHIAHHQIRTRGTVGGSLAHADPAAELPCLAVLCDAEIEIFGPAGARHVPAASFFTGPLTTVLAMDELITGMRLPYWPEERCWAFEEFSRRRGDFALAGVGLFFDPQKDIATNVHIATLGIGDMPVRLTGAEGAFNDRALRDDAIKDCCKSAQADIDPKDDIHGSSAYRRALVNYLLAEALRHAIAKRPRAPVKC
jgi:aerobic carbon-monoxide dehydrogenase medium subunit